MDDKYSNAYYKIKNKVSKLPTGNNSFQKYLK